MQRRLDPFFYRLFVLTCIFILFYLIYSLSAVIIPFVVAFVLAYVFNPWVSFLQRFHIRRWLAILLVYTSIGMGIGLLLSWFVPIVWEQIQSLWRFLPTIVEWYNSQVIIWFEKHLSVSLPPIAVSEMTVGSLSLLDYLKSNYNITDMRSFFASLFLSGISVVNVAGVVALIPIFMFYFLYNWNERLQIWQQAIPRPYVKKVNQIVKESDDALMAFIKGQLLVMFLLGVVYAIQLQLIGLNVGLIIGMVAGIASFVPYLGFAIGFLAAMIAGFFQFGLDWHLFLIAMAFMVGQVVESYILQPLLLGNKIGLSPLWVMFTVLAGASLLGLVGMLIALPIAAVVNVLVRHGYQAYQESDVYLGRQQLNLFDFDDND